MKNKIIFLVSMLVLIIGTVSYANYETFETGKELKNIETINAKDIGIKTITKEEIKDEFVVSEIENSDMDENQVYSEEVEDEILICTELAETEEEDTLQEEIEPIEEEDLSEPPQDMYEGYVSGEYFNVNCYDCELHDKCYKCEECTLVEEIGYDEEVNSNDGYYLYTYCVVCGHGEFTPIDESEIG